MKSEKPKQKTIPRFIDLLGGEQIIKKNTRSDFDLAKLCNDGIPMASLDALSKYMGISGNDFLEKILDRKAFNHESSLKKFDRHTSSYILEIGKVVEHAYQVFEDEQKVKRWLNYRSQALNTTPLELFGTFTGIKIVDDELGRIEHGIFS